MSGQLWLKTLKYNDKNLNEWILLDDNFILTVCYFDRYNPENLGALEDYVHVQVNSS